MKNNKPKFIIGLGHQMGVGKDEIARVLTQHYGFVVMKFADSLKESVASIFGWKREQLEDPVFKAQIDPFWKFTPRHVLQQIGTDVMREHWDTDIWVKSLQRRILNSEHERIVITDVRFPNEVIAISQWGGYNVKVLRPGFSDLTGNKHVSEKLLEGYLGWDHIVNNDGTRHDLELATFEMFHKLKLNYLTDLYNDKS